MVCSLKRSSLRNCPIGDQFAVDEERVESLPLRPTRDIGVESFARFHQRREDSERPAFHRGFHLLDDRGEALFLDRQIAVRAKLRPRFREEEAEEMVNFRDRGDGGFPAATRDALLDRHARRHAFHEIDVRLFQLLDELPRVGRHAVEKTALPFGEKNVEGDRRFSRAAQAGDDDHLVARNIERDVLQIVLARAVDANGVDDCRREIAEASSAARANSSSSSSA